MDSDLKAASWDCAHFAHSERRDSCGGSAKLDIIRRLRNGQLSGHFVSLPPRHAQLIRADPWFQNAIHRRSDELDVNPRSVVSSCANDYANPVAASELPIQKPVFGNSGSAFCYATSMLVEHDRLYVVEIIVFCIPVIPERCFVGQKPDAYFVVVAVGTPTGSREHWFCVCQM